MVHCEMLIFGTTVRHSLSAMQANRLFWNVFANNLDAVAQRKTLVRIGSNRRIQRRMSDCNAGSRRNDPPDVLVVAIPQLNPKWQPHWNVV